MSRVSRPGALAAEPPDVACSAVMGALVGSERSRDDIALLMIRRQQAPARRPGSGRSA